eukprot:2642029-Amphidinium_carterae.2
MLAYAPSQHSGVKKSAVVTPKVYKDCTVPAVSSPLDSLVMGLHAHTCSADPSDIGRYSMWPFVRQYALPMT